MGTKKYSVILIDPPWDYKNFTDALHGAMHAHYEGMTQSELAVLPIHQWAHSDCILILWSTWPKLNEAIYLIQRWGFEYLTGIPWIKTSPSSGEIRTGIGFWYQSCSELILLGKKGSPSRFQKIPTFGLLCGSQKQFYCPITRHSAKPVDLYDYIESQFNGNYLELFARNQRTGWTCWGNELGQKLSSKGVEEV